jgi:uncharacterized protein
MKFVGDAILNAPVDKAWHALNDPAVLARTIPGCTRLEATGPDTYSITVSAGVASIKGTYRGNVRLNDHVMPGSFMIYASGSGGPGTVDATVEVRLEELDGDRTKLTYDADAVIGGMIGGVGQRVLTGVSKKMAGEFFQAVDGVLTGREPAPAAATTGAAPDVFEAPAAAAGPASGEFAKGVIFGAVAALLGAVVGGLIGRRAPR